MKKMIYLTLMAIVLAVFGAAAVSAQDLNQLTDPAYTCGYYYPDGQRLTDCHDENGTYIPAESGSTPVSADAYEGFAADTTARQNGFAPMGDTTDDYDGEPIYGDPDGVHFVQRVDYFSRFGNYEATVSVPMVRGMADGDAEKGLNEYISSVAYGIIDQFEADARAILSEYGDSDELPHFMTNYSFHVQTDSDSVLTLALEYFTVAGSSYISTSYFNFNKDTRELILMSDYFTPGTAAAEILRDELLRQMREQMAASPEIIYWIDDKESEIALDWDDLFASVSNNNSYYIDENGDFVIAFAKYDVGPGVMGNPKFLIPTDVVAAMDAALVQP